MSDRGILFSAPMVLALLAGRKTQTRRILKPQPDTTKISSPFHPEQREGRRWVFMARDDFPEYSFATADFRLAHAVGDRLWVREAWRVPAQDDAIKPRDLKQQIVGFEADCGPGTIPATGRLRPGMFMPRWASRLTLTLTDVRVQRLHEITETDALAEGVEMESADPPFYYVPGIWPHSITAVGIEDGSDHAVRSFAKLWNHIHGAEAWDANPWVCAVTFSVRKGNIDAG